MDFQSKLGLRLVVTDARCKETVSAIAASAKMIKTKDGKVFFSSSESAQRVPTGKAGEGRSSDTLFRVSSWVDRVV